MSRDLIVALRESVGAANVITDPDVMQPYVVDWTRRFGGPAVCVVRPGSVDDVAAVLRICTAEGVPVIPQGGNSGLVGGAVPGPGGPHPVVLSLRRLDWMGEVNQLSGQISCGAGATLGALQRAATSAGWAYGVDLAARDTATVGGTVATNAGGIRVIAYGMTRAQLVGIEAVLADGTVVSHMEGLLKDNTGLDLAALMCGSEGTLAVITAVRVRLHRPLGSATVALIGCESYADALDVMSSVRGAGHELVGAEVMDDTGMGLACSVTGLPYPFSRRFPLVALVETADGGTADGLAGLTEREVVVAADAHQRQRLWRYRESQADGFATLGILHKLDISVPLPQLAECAGGISQLLTSSESVTGFGIFGHIGDGNLHVEFAGPPADDIRVDRAVLECVARYAGSISAEHGIGRAKAEFLHLSRSNAEIEAMRAIKHAWDPQGILNPGALFT